MRLLAILASMLVGVLAPAAASGSALPAARLFSNPLDSMSLAATAIDGGSTHTCAVLSDGSVECWGFNYYGQLGNGTTLNSSVPVPVSLLSSAVDVGAGSTHSCALLAVGSVVCWGSNAVGQLGDGTTTDSPIPVLVSSLPAVVQLSVGDYFSCALLGDGTVDCWGSNFRGALGDGTTTSRSIPAPVSGLSGVTAIGAGGAHACALLADGSVSCWGNNYSGEVGDGTTVDRYAPVPVNGLGNVSAMAVGGAHTCALLVGGTAACWGYNLDGQLGDGTRTDRSSPAPVIGLTGVRAIAGGGDHTCALLTTGSIECWGWNFYGQVGVGQPPVDALYPMLVPGISVAGEVTGGGNHTCALLPGGHVDCWGSNDYGQIGDGSTGFQILFPVVVVGLGTAVGPTISQQPLSQAVGEGAIVTFESAASGIPTPDVQWQEHPSGGGSWTPIPSATDTFYVLTASVADSGSQYRAVFTNEAGSATSTPATLTVLPAPTISSLSATSGGPGRAVTITGTHFGGTTSVSFNGTPAAFAVLSDTTIVTSVPAGATRGPISVVTPGGRATSSTFAVGKTSVLPKVTKIDPKVGPVGTLVTVTGTNLAGARSVSFGSTTLTSGWSVLSATSLRVAVPDGAQSGPIAVTTDGGTGTSTATFTVTAATLRAPVNNGVTLTLLHGYNDPAYNTTSPVACPVGSPPPVSDHCRNQQYGLDFQPGAGWDGKILAPAAGTVSYVTSPCVGIRLADGRNVQLCHLGGFAVTAGQMVSEGTVLGTADTSWIHISMDTGFDKGAAKCSGGWTVLKGQTAKYRCPLQFVSAYSIEGTSLPWDGSANQTMWNGSALTLTSSNQEQ